MVIQSDCQHKRPHRVWWEDGCWQVECNRAKIAVQQWSRGSKLTIRELDYWLQVCPACVKLHPSTGNVPRSYKSLLNLLSSSKLMSNTLTQTHTHTHNTCTQIQTRHIDMHLLTDTIRPKMNLNLTQPHCTQLLPGGTLIGMYLWMWQIHYRLYMYIH